MKNFLTALFALFYGIALSQTQLTKVVSSNRSSNSHPQSPITFNGKLYFVATEAHTGTELWKTDGTGANTSLVKDINFGNSNSIISNLIVFKNKLYFVADDGVHGPQFWVSDGTPEGTSIVTNNLSYAIYTIVASGDYIYFLRAVDSRLGVWKFDGSNNGLTLVKGEIPTLGAPDNLTNALGMVFFSAQTGNGGYSKVWRTDGTEEGTYAVTEELYGNGSNVGGGSHPTQFIEYHGSLYFVAVSYSKFGSNSIGIVKTNGTIPGTEYLMGIGSEVVEFGNVVSHADKLYFSFYDFDDNRYSIWESGGTKLSTRNIYDLSSDSYFSPSSLCSYNDGLFFSSGNNKGGTSLIKYNAVTGEFYEISEMATQIARPPFFISGGYSASHIIAGKLLYIELVKTDINFGEIWVSDGKALGTTKLSSSANSLQKNIILYNDMLFYPGVSGSEIELWKSNGTTAGTEMVRDINPSVRGIVLSSPLVKVNNLVLFGGATDSFGHELWVSDGTESGTKMIKDIVPGKPGSFPDNFIVTSDHVYFTAGTGGGNAEVFTSDGTALGTKQVTDFSVLSGHSERLVKIDHDKLIVEVIKQDYTTSLFLMEAAGSVTEIASLGTNSYNAPYNITDMTLTSDGILYFFVTADGTDLWRSDGTTSGTFKVADFTNVFQLTAAANELYFIKKNSSGSSKGDLYACDGTSSTRLLKSNVQQSSLTPKLIAYKNKLVFTAFDASTGGEIWITDGTLDNTKLLKDIANGPESSVTQPGFQVSNGLLYFTASNDVSGSELWQTDGTASGTKMVKDIAPGNTSSKPYGVTSLTEDIYFAAYTETNGYEIWHTKGTETGLLAEVLPGSASSNPHDFVVLGDDLLVFMAESLIDGQQLFAFKGLITNVEDDKQQLVEIYPNPSHDVFNINTNGLEGSILFIYNTSGSLVSSYSIIGSESSINLQEYPSGLYLLRFTKNDKLYTFKIVKK